MKTLADFKRRIKVGTKLKCIHNTYRPVLDGTTREVVKVQTVGFYWTSGTDSHKSHTEYPKAADFTVIDADTAEWKLWAGADHTVRLQFIA